MLSCVWLFATPWMVACQVPLPMESSRQGYWGGLPLPPPGDLLIPGLEPASPAFVSGILYHWVTWEVENDSVSSVQSLSHVRLFETPWIVAHQASPSITNSQSLPKPMSIESVMPSNHLIPCRPLFLPSDFASIRVFSNKLTLHIKWPKYCRFSISSSNEYSGLIFFRIDWFDLFVV